MFSGWEEYTWDQAEGDWAGDYRGTCTYGSKGKITTVITQYLDEDLGKWEDGERIDAVI